MIHGAPLEDARHLGQRYSRMRQEAELNVSQNIKYLLILFTKPVALAQWELFLLSVP